MNKANFEKLIKKDISDETFSLYNALWIAYKENIGDEAHKKDFIKLLNIKSIPQDNELKEKRQAAKKLLPELNKKLKNLEVRKKDLEQTIQWLDKQKSQIVDQYKYEKLSVAKEIKQTKLEILRLKNSIK